MNENPAAISQEPSFFANMAMYEQSLSDIEMTYAGEMSLLNKARSQATLLLLQLMYFLADLSLDDTKAGI